MKYHFKRVKKKDGVNHHKIAILISLLLDYASDHEKVTDICCLIIDDLYDNIEGISKGNYFQNLSKEVENRLNTDLLMLGLLCIKAFIEVNADNPKALELIKELEIMCNSQNQIYSKIDLEHKWQKLNTIVRLNYKSF
tara:strand:+ start:1656 stop:2069 length:414 start_codon:yes stop_codon:yes gene_type:complete